MAGLKRQTPGIIVPPLTPFQDDLTVDFARLKRGIDIVIERSRPRMLVAAGVEAQEYQYLSSSARLDLIRATLDAAQGRCPVAVGISHPSYKSAIELAHFAERNGAEALQLLAPNKPTGGVPTTAELVRYFDLVGRETKLPIVLYLNAGPGADVSPQAAVELARLDCIHFVKESSRDVTRVSRLIADIQHAGLADYFTTMQMLLLTLQLGGAGVTLPSPASEIARFIIAAFEAGEIERAATLQRVFMLYPARWMPFGLAAVMKASASHLGRPAGDPYPPYQAVSGEALFELHAFLDANLGFLKDNADA